MRRFQKSNRTSHQTDSLSQNVRMIYEMIAGRMFGGFFRYMYKRFYNVVLHIADFDFSIKRAVIKQIGWSAVYKEK